MKICEKGAIIRINKMAEKFSGREFCHNPFSTG